MTTRFIALIAALASALVLTACGNGGPGDKGKGGDAKPETKADTKKGPPGSGGPVPARVIEIAARREPVKLESVGQVEGSREVEVRARVGGIVQKRSYNEGETVKAGATLFQIDPAPFEITLAQARAALGQERARNEQARREAGRLKELATQKAISQKEFDDATSNLKLSDASVQAAEAKIREAELNLSYTQVIAPVGGVTGRAARSEGSLVSNVDVLTTISQITPVWVRFALAEPEVARLPGARVGADAEIRLILGDGSTYPGRGRLNFAESRIDQRLGTRQLRAEFDNPSDAAGGRLLPGQFVRVVVSVNRQQPVFLVPQSAVLQTDKGYVVMTLDAENKVAPRPVQVGEWSGSDWIIQSGLKPGDRVVVDNLMKLQPGVTVSPIADQAANGAPAQQQNAAGAPGQQPANGDPAAKGEASAGAKK